MLRIFPFKTDGVITEIEQLEKNYSISLPEKYKEFLLKYNGGDTIDTRFKIEKIRSDIHSFYGFSLANHFSNFNYLVEKGFLEDFIENHYLPIAKDSFGNSILIGVGASNYNKIVLGTIYLFTLTTIWSASENIQKGDFRNGNRLLM